jgi:hypothetical protein
MNDLAKKFWIALRRNAAGEGGAGGAGGDGGQAGADPAGGEGGATSAGAEDPSPSLLSNAATVAGDDGQTTVTGADGQTTVAGGDGDGKPNNPPAAFDVAALTLPEGVTLDEESSKAFSEILGDEKLTPQERGQKLVDMHVNALNSLRETVTSELTAANLKAFGDMNADWAKQARELPEFKANPEAEIGKVFQALKTVGAGEDFFKAVDLTGAGNHPAILQVIHRLVQPFLEGGSVGGDSKTVAKREPGANIYTSATKPQ